MSKQTINAAGYVKSELKNVEAKLDHAALDAKDTKDAVLIEKVSGLQKSVKETREYIEKKLSKDNG